MQQGVFVMPSVSGSASSGSYVKLQDGTMIQWGRVGVSVPSNSSYVDSVVQYPTAFHASSDIMVNVSAAATNATTGTLANVCIPVAFQIAGSDRLTQFSLRTYKQASVGASENNPTPSVTWVAIGRWKE